MDFASKKNKIRTNMAPCSSSSYNLEDVDEDRRASPLPVSHKEHLTQLSPPVAVLRESRRSSLKKLFELLRIDSDSFPTKQQVFPIDCHLDTLFQAGKILANQPKSIDMNVSRLLGKGTYGLCYE
ncbi:hypothetical protein Ciccas_009977, partial [Cichlidogyrus casuarinus]